MEKREFYKLEVGDIICNLKAFPVFTIKENCGGYIILERIVGIEEFQNWHLLLKKESLKHTFSNLKLMKG